MKTFLFSLFLGVSSLLDAHAQIEVSTNRWHMGVITLVSGQVLSGDIHYDGMTELVQLRTKNFLKALSANQVLSFRFNEQSYGMLREFVSLEFNSRTGYSRKTFFEVVLKGPLTLLRKPHRVKDFFKAGSGQQVDGRPGFFDYMTGFSYFVHTQNQFLGIRHFKKDILPLMTGDHGDQVRQLIKDKKMKLFALDNQVRLINYYNFLKNPMSHTASVDNATAAN